MRAMAPSDDGGAGQTPPANDWFAKDQVYRVRSEQDAGALIALDVQVRDDTLSWFDSYRDRGHRITSKNKDGDTAVFETESGTVYRFSPLTKEIYDAEVRTQVELSPEFDTTEALRTFYLRNFLGMDLQDEE